MASKTLRLHSAWIEPPQIRGMRRDLSRPTVRPRRWDSRLAIAIGEARRDKLGALLGSSNFRFLLTGRLPEQSCACHTGKIVPQVIDIKWRARRDSNS
jgi:hypothetical protein